MSFTTSAISAPYVKQYMSTAKIRGVPNDTIAIDDNFSSLTTTNPTEQWFWIVGAQNADQSTATVVNIRVDMVFYVRFFDRVIPPQSA